jgi:hypothetical protein
MQESDRRWRDVRLTWFRAGRRYLIDLVNP